MKKVRIFILFMSLFLGMFFFMPVKVFANSTFPFNGTGNDWYNHISQYDYAELGYGRARSKIFYDGYDLVLLIVEEPFQEFVGCIFDWYHYSYWNYFRPDLKYIRTCVVDGEVSDTEDILEMLEQDYGQAFDGFFYWNFEQQYWQLQQYGISELDYYKQRVDDLEDEISSLEDEISSLEDEISSLEDEISSLEDEISSLEDEISSLEDEISSLEDEISSLEDEISSLEDEISSLEDEISSLEDEIQQLEDALVLEYDRGYNDGYNEGLLVENNNDITKWFVPLIVIIIVVGIIEPIILIKRRG